MSAFFYFGINGHYINMPAGRLSNIKKLFSGEERSVTVKKNIAALALLKGISVVITFLLVPMTLHYLQPVQYGIWLTLSSIVAWMIYFDRSAVIKEKQDETLHSDLIAFLASRVAGGGGEFTPGSRVIAGGECSGRSRWQIIRSTHQKRQGY